MDEYDAVESFSEKFERFEKSIENSYRQSLKSNRTYLSIDMEKRVAEEEVDALTFEQRVKEMSESIGVADTIQVCVDTNPEYFKFLLKKDRLTLTDTPTARGDFEAICYLIGYDNYAHHFCVKAGSLLLPINLIKDEEEWFIIFEDVSVPEIRVDPDGSGSFRVDLIKVGLKDAINHVQGIDAIFLGLMSDDMIKKTKQAIHKAWEEINAEEVAEAKKHYGDSVGLYA